jgi:predicted nucleotidyltransferase
MREELVAELLPVPEPPEPPPSPEPPGIHKILAHALGHVRGKRGGDLVAVLLIGSGAHQALTPHSDLDLMVLVKGHDDSHEIIRIADRYIDIRYRNTRVVEADLANTVSLVPLLRKARILFEQEAVGSKLVTSAQQRFRQGPPPLRLIEKIRLKAECLHWLGKAEDLLIRQPATAEYLLALFFEDLLQAFYRMRGLWPMPPAERIRFAALRDRDFGELLEQFQRASTTALRLEVGHQLAEQLFKDVPNPQRVD